MGPRMTRGPIPRFEFQVFIDLDHAFAGRTLTLDEAMYVCKEEWRVAGEGAIAEMEKRLREVLI